MTQQGRVDDSTGSSRKTPWIGQTGGTKQWLKRHFEQNAQFNRMKTADLVFVGDSITEFWTSQGRPVWQKEFRGLKVANAGIAADRTEQMIWRLAKGSVTKLKPKGYIIMAGTNNLAMRDPDSPDGVAKAVEGMVRTVRATDSLVPVLVLSILPNSADPDLAKRIQETNELIRVRCTSLKSVTYLDLWPEFSDENQRLKPDLTLDGTHLSEKGYQLWADAIRPVWKEWIASEQFP